MLTDQSDSTRHTRQRPGEGGGAVSVPAQAAGATGPGQQGQDSATLRKLRAKVKEVNAQSEANRRAKGGRTAGGTS